MAKEETTFFAFYTNVRIFLSALLKKPLKAEPSDYLLKRGFNKSRLITALLKKGVISRNEKINTVINNDDKKAIYEVKYKLHRENFERKIKRIYQQFFEKNLPEKDGEKTVVIDECDCGGCAGATSAGVCNDSAPIVPLGSPIYRPSLLAVRGKKKKKGHDPTTINGKTITAENVDRKRRNFIMTEEQIERILKRQENVKE